MVRMTGTAEGRTRSGIVPHVSLGLLAMQTLFYVPLLNWGQCVRISLIAAGFAYLLWRYRGGDAGAGGTLPVPALLLALVYIFLLNQFDPVTLGGELDLGGLPPAWVSPALIAGAFVACGWNGGLRRGWHWLDWVAIGLGLFLTSVFVGGTLVAGKEIPWHTPGKILTSVALWFAVRGAYRTLPGASRRLAIGVLGALVFVVLAGCVRVGAVYFYARKGQDAQTENALPAAADHYGRALALGRELELRDTVEGMAFRLAGVLFAQGMEDEAAEALSLDKGFVTTVPADGWDGPEGGHLYYLVSCWKDLDLVPGEVKIEINAQGTPALGEWPQMRVSLGDVVLGYVSVESRETAAYGFEVHVKERERQRLEISFINDYFQAEPHADRNLRIEQAEVRYRSIEWD